MKERIAIFGKQRIEWRRLRGRAGAAVSNAVKKGILVNLKKTIVSCADCGSRADVYDHRDYSRPLDVVAVCRGCNIKRGTNAPTEKVDNGKPRCSTCNSGQVYLRLRTKDYICRQCGLSTPWEVKK